MSNLHLCVGFYPNGEYKVNTVSDKNLESNISYNKLWRPGRFYFVDDEYVCGGVLKEPHKTKFIEECKRKIKEMNLTDNDKESEVFW